MERLAKRPEPCDVGLTRDSYQPSRGDLREDHRVGATFKVVVEACLRPARIHYVAPRKSKAWRSRRAVSSCCRITCRRR